MMAKILQKIDERPDMVYLNSFVKPQLCAACVVNSQIWKDLGTELMPNAVTALSIISVNHGNNVVNCCSNMFQLWLQRLPNASWKQLIKALQKVNLNHLATQIEGMLIPSVKGDAASFVPSKQPLITDNNLRAEFARLTKTISCILDKTTDREYNLESCKQICDYLKAIDNTSALFSAESRTKINGSKDFRQLCDNVSPYLSWNDYSILTEFIYECDLDEAIEELSKYKRKMAIFKALEVIRSTKPELPIGFEKICIILDEPYTRIKDEKYEEAKAFILENLCDRHYLADIHIRVLLT